MVKCPFCHFDNEEGALFCEQCKSDLAGVEPVIAAEPVVAQVYAVAAADIIETVPVAMPEGGRIIEATLTESVHAEIVPLASVVLESPPPVETMPHVEAPNEHMPQPVHVPVDEVAPLNDSIPIAPVLYAEPTQENLSPPTPAPAPVQAAPAVAEPGVLPPHAQPRLLVLRGLKRNIEYPIYEGHNFIGRADEKPVDIDLDDQEPPDRIWSSRQHALITLDIDSATGNGRLNIEDLNSSNGTFVNRTRIYPGQKCALNVNDIIQIGTVQMKIII